MLNIYYVSASFLYTEDGQQYERSIGTEYICESPEAKIAGVKWAINRGEANEFGDPSCIKIHVYHIGTPEPNGYIRTTLGGSLLEWKYDTSPWTVRKLLEHCEKEKQ